MTPQPYDLIGDIHGQHGKLRSLLDALGYQPKAGSFRHPQGRKVIFLGDYIDRGPDARAVLHTVRGMVEAGDALAIMGNHEYNAVAWATPDGWGGWLREHREDRDRGHLETLRQFSGLEDEWKEWMAWMSRLPMFLDLGALRAVHACWDAKRIAILQGQSIADAEFLAVSSTRRTPEYRAIQHVLKGPELALPAGACFHDKEGTRHTRVRIRWWDLPDKSPAGRIAMPAPYESADDTTVHRLKNLPCYGPDEPPVFVGHYWLPPHRERAPLAPNIACLDYSAAFADNALTAYRWDGERVLSANKFVSAS